jgi:hypothetical protein
MLIAAAIQIGGSIEGFFWPKVTWDFSTSSLNVLVKPFPILQTVNLILGIVILAWEWPLSLLAGTMFHRSIHARLVVFAICAVTSMFLYQAHSSTIYYLLGSCGYLIALKEREVSPLFHKKGGQLMLSTRLSTPNHGRFPTSKRCPLLPCLTSILNKDSKRSSQKRPTKKTLWMFQSMKENQISKNLHTIPDPGQKSWSSVVSHPFQKINLSTILLPVLIILPV